MASFSAANSTCVLSEQGRAFSNILTPLVSITWVGLTSGTFVAAISGLLSCFSVLRLLLSAVINLAYTPQRGPSKIPSSKFHNRSTRSHTSNPSYDQLPLSPLPRPKIVARTVDAIDRLHAACDLEAITTFGTLGWLYTAVYSPVKDVLWVVENFREASGPVLLVRALGLSAAGIALTVDVKWRYASRLQHIRYLGVILGPLFVLVNFASTLILGVLCAMLLINGLIAWPVSWLLIALYCVLLVLATMLSFIYCPVQEGDIPNSGRLFGTVVGAFVGLVVALPAIGVYATAPAAGSGEVSLQQYISCDSVATWRKFVAIFP